MTERLLMGRKKSNQTNTSLHCTLNSKYKKFNSCNEARTFVQVCFRIWLSVCGTSKCNGTQLGNILLNLLGQVCRQALSPRMIINTMSFFSDGWLVNPVAILIYTNFTPVIILFPTEHCKIRYSSPIFNDIRCMISVFTIDLEAGWKTG